MFKMMAFSTQPGTPLINGFVDHVLWYSCPSLDERLFQFISVMNWRPVHTFLHVTPDEMSTGFRSELFESHMSGAMNCIVSRSNRQIVSSALSRCAVLLEHKSVACNASDRYLAHSNVCLKILSTTCMRCIPLKYAYADFFIKMRFSFENFVFTNIDDVMATRHLRHCVRYC